MNCQNLEFDSIIFLSLSSSMADTAIFTFYRALSQPCKSSHHYKIATFILLPCGPQIKWLNFFWIQSCVFSTSSKYHTLVFFLFVLIPYSSNYYSLTLTQIAKCIVRIEYFKFYFLFSLDFFRTYPNGIIENGCLTVAGALVAPDVQMASHSFSLKFVQVATSKKGQRSSFRAGVLNKYILYIKNHEISFSTRDFAHFHDYYTYLVRCPGTTYTLSVICECQVRRNISIKKFHISSSSYVSRI